jgi:hypothetical protein
LVCCVERIEQVGIVRLTCGFLPMWIGHRDKLCIILLALVDNLCALGQPQDFARLRRLRALYGVDGEGTFGHDEYLVISDDPLIGLFFAIACKANTHAAAVGLIEHRAEEYLAVSPKLS